MRSKQKFFTQKFIVYRSIHLTKRILKLTFSAVIIAVNRFNYKLLTADFQSQVFR